MSEDILKSSLEVMRLNSADMGISGHLELSDIKKGIKFAIQKAKAQQEADTAKEIIEIIECQKFYADSGYECGCKGDPTDKCYACELRDKIKATFLNSPDSSEATKADYEPRDIHSQRVSTGEYGSSVPCKDSISGEEPICKPETLPSDFISKAQVAQAIDELHPHHLKIGVLCYDCDLVHDLKQKLGLSGDHE